MDEIFRKNVKHFLAGTLNKSDTLLVLDKIKESEACRRYLEEQVRLSAASQHPHVATNHRMPNHACSPTSPNGAHQTAAASNPSAFGPILRRRTGFGAKRTIMFGCILMAVLFAFRPGSKKEDAPKLTAQDIVVAEAITEGSPISISPKGTCDSRPMGVTAFLPSGNESGQLVFMSSGVELLRWDFNQGDFGVQMESAMILSETGKLPAMEIVLPFPDKSALPLEKGKRYFYFLELPNGRQSAPQRIDIR